MYIIMSLYILVLYKVLNETIWSLSDIFRALSLSCLYFKTLGYPSLPPQNISSLTQSSHLNHNLLLLLSSQLAFSDVINLPMRLFLRASETAVIPHACTALHAHEHTHTYITHTNSLTTAVYVKCCCSCDLIFDLIYLEHIMFTG